MQHISLKSETLYEESESENSSDAQAWFYTALSHSNCNMFVQQDFMVNVPKMTDKLFDIIIIS